MRYHEILFGFGISVVASICSVVILLIIRAIRDYMLEKYGHKLIFAHVSDFSGNWQTENEDHQGNKMSELMTIEQLGSKIKGTIKYQIHYRDSEIRHKEFSIQGIIRNDLITIFYFNSNRRQKGIGACLFSLSDDGKEMKGKCIWWDVEKDSMDQTNQGEDVVWSKS